MSDMKNLYNKDEDFKEEMKDDSQSKKKVYLKKKVCRFCADKNMPINYKEIDIIKKFITEGGKILPRRITGNCSKHQRRLAEQVKIARQIALLPYVKK